MLASKHGTVMPKPPMPALKPMARPEAMPALPVMRLCTSITVVAEEAVIRKKPRFSGANSQMRLIWDQVKKASPSQIKPNDKAWVMVKGSP